MRVATLLTWGRQEQSVFRRVSHLQCSVSVSVSVTLELYSDHLDKYPEMDIALMNLFNSIFNFILINFAVFCNSPFLVFSENLVQTYFYFF